MKTWQNISDEFERYIKPDHPDYFLIKMFKTNLDEYVRSLIGEDESKLVITDPSDPVEGHYTEYTINEAIRNEFRRELLKQHEENMEEK